VKEATKIEAAVASDEEPEPTEPTDPAELARATYRLVRGLKLQWPLDRNELHRRLDEHEGRLPPVAAATAPPPPAPRTSSMIVEIAKTVAQSPNKQALATFLGLVLAAFVAALSQQCQPGHFGAPKPVAPTAAPAPALRPPPTSAPAQ
jgi:hypothetical protein